jgi:hypothetical protein
MRGTFIRFDGRQQAGMSGVPWLGVSGANGWFAGGRRARSVRLNLRDWDFHPRDGKEQRGLASGAMEPCESAFMSLFIPIFPKPVCRDSGSRLTIWRAECSKAITPQRARRNVMRARLGSSEDNSR